MKRKSILLVLCIGMILTSCESKISLNSTDVKNEKNQKNTTMENPDKGYNLPIDEDKKKEAVNDCEEIMGIIRDIYSEYNGIQEADQNTAEQMMNRMKEIIKQNGNPVIGSDHYSVMDNYQKMEQFLKSAEQEEKGSVILYEADTDGGITRKEYSYDGKEMSVMSAKMIWSEDTEPVLTYISLSKIKEWAYTENGNFCYELCVPVSKKREIEEMIRTIRVEEITKNIKEMCIEANHFLSPDMAEAMKCAEKNEEAPLGKQILEQLQENLKIAGEDMIPICQDTGMAVVFLEIGQDVHLEGGALEDAVNEGVRQGYVEGYLRKSVVGDPLIRENTKDNTPAVLHTRIVDGDQVKIKVAPKGFGSENMSRVFMLKPAEGIEGVKDAVLTAVKDAGPNACPPMVVGVGIGGTFEKCALMAKEALTREVGSHSEIEYVKELEEELLTKINSLGIGPGGLGGTTTALAVNINTYPTHIAGLPVAVNICCHVNRHVIRTI